jgi:virulence factor
MIKVGIIGKGYFGKKIYKTLKDRYNVVFFTARDMDITYDIDWVVIATSTLSHYDLCKQFILNGVNVFVEKPMTLSWHDSKELLELAEENNVKVYIDDVFKYTETFKRLSDENLDYNPLYFD